MSHKQISLTISILDDDYSDKRSKNDMEEETRESFVADYILYSSFGHSIHSAHALAITEKVESRRVPQCILLSIFLSGRSSRVMIPMTTEAYIFAWQYRRCSEYCLASFGYSLLRNSVFCRKIMAAKRQKMLKTH